jgi:branched-chain amino acid transport system ATP-binding protein
VAEQNGVLLEVRGLSAGFGSGPVLFDVDLDFRAGELLALIGANGAGKSTLLGVLSGLVPPMQGRVVFDRREVTGLRPERIVRAGMAHVPQGRRLFGTMTVEQNLRLGAFVRSDRDVRQDIEKVVNYFPTLGNKLQRVAGTLSGGEQQMVAIGRGLMGRPKLLMIDEPSLGLAPKVVDTVVDVCKAINKDGVSVLLVEQDVVVALEAADRGYVLENGRIVMSGSARELANDPGIRKAYLGV